MHYELSQSFFFEAAHTLRRKLDDAAEVAGSRRIHGHTYHAEICVRGAPEDDTGMVVDHRTYDFHPGKMPAWIKAYEEMGLPVQQRLLGQLLVFAVTEIGPINQIVFCWLYESYGDRDKRRTAMANDPQWQEFGKVVAGLGALKQQTVMGLRPTSFSLVK